MSMLDPVKAPITAATRLVRRPTHADTKRPAPPLPQPRPEVELVPGDDDRPNFAHAVAHAAGELGTWVRHVPQMRRHRSIHDGQPVLVLPGFLAHDALTYGMRKMLAHHEYPVYGWKLGVNLGPTDKALDGMRARLHEIADRHEAPVSIIGWSLGGLYARQLAREYPEHVRQVITLGSPINLTLDETDRTAVHQAFERLKPLFSDELAELGRPESEKTPLIVPATSIYSRADEIVPWDSCLDRYGTRAISESIEVKGTHIGLPQNRAVNYALFDRLSQPSRHWRHFVPTTVHAKHYPSHQEVARVAQHGLGR